MFLKYLEDFAFSMSKNVSLSPFILQATNGVTQSFAFLKHFCVPFCFFSVQ